MILFAIELNSDEIFNYIHIVSEYTFRFIFYTWTGITLIGTSDEGLYMSFIVILYGIYNLIYHIKCNKNRGAEEVTSESFDDIDAPLNNDVFT